MPEVTATPIQASTGERDSQSPAPADQIGEHQTGDVHVDTSEMTPETHASHGVTRGVGFGFPTYHEEPTQVLAVRSADTGMQALLKQMKSKRETDSPFHLLKRNPGNGNLPYPGFYDLDVRTYALTPKTRAKASLQLNLEEGQKTERLCPSREVYNFLLRPPPLM